MKHHDQGPRERSVGPKRELGCGCGAIAEQIGALTGPAIYGINIDKSQIDKALKTPVLQKDTFTATISTYLSSLPTTRLTQFTRFNL